MKANYDLHTHTTASDGTNSPAVQVKLALEAGLAGIAITDHDTVAGIAEAVAEGKKLGIDVIPGVEISTVSGGQDVHVLGYFIDPENRLFLDRLEQMRRTRDLRNDMMLARLAELGLPVTMEEVLEQSKKQPGKDETIGRPHIAQVMIAKGYVADMSEAFDRYLGKHGAAYVNPPRIRPEDAIDWIREAGGVPVIAHPGLYEDEQLVRRLIDYGVSGIEAFHPDHSPETESHYSQLAQSNGLLVTAGSDFHGSRNGVVFHAPLGARTADAGVVERLMAIRDKVW